MNKAKYDVKSLKYYILMIALSLLLYFVGYSIQMFGVNNTWESLGSQFSIFYVNVITGGNLSNLSLFALGMGPIISSSIIVQLLESELSSKVKSWRELGDLGKIYKTRLQYVITGIISTITAVGIVLSLYLNSSGTLTYSLGLSLIIIPLQLVSASLFLQMIAKWIDERFFYSGTSLLLTYGIILNLIDMLSFDMFSATEIIITSLLFFVMLIIIVLVNSSSIEINGTSYNYNTDTYNSPFRISFSQTGVIALIYASPLMVLGNYLLGKLDITNEVIANMFNLADANPLTIIIYFTLILVFSILYTYIVMDTDIISETLLRQGYYVYNVNPGYDTSKFLKGIILKVGVVGGLLIALIAVSPYLVSFVYSLPGITVILSTSLIIMTNTATKIFNILYINFKKES